MKFFKKILTFSVVAILLLCLVGCGNQNTETAIANNLEKSTTNLMSTLNKLEEISYNDIVIKEISPLADSTYNTVNTSALQKIKWHTIGKTVNLEPDVKFVNAQLTYENENSEKTSTSYGHKTQEITDDVTYSYKPKYVNNVSDSFSRKYFNSFVNSVENIYCQCSDCISCDAECKNTKDQLKNNINDTKVLCQKLRDGTIKMKSEDIENCKTQINNLNDCIKRLARTNGNVNIKCNDIKSLKENFSSHIGSVQDAYSRLLNTLETRLDYLDCCNEKLNEICDVINQTNVNKTEIQNNLSDEQDIAKIENNEIVKSNENTEQNTQNSNQNGKDNNNQNIQENNNQNVTENKNNNQQVENQNGNQNDIDRTNQNNTDGTNQNSISNQKPNQTNNNIPPVQNVNPQQNTIPNANAPYYNNGAYNGNGVYNGYNNGVYNGYNNGYNYNYPPRNIDTYQNIEKNIDTYSPKFPVLNNQNANGLNSNGTNNVVTATQSNEVATKTTEEKTSKDEKENNKQENSIEKILKKDSQNNRQVVAPKKKMPKRKEAIKPIDDGKSNNIDSPLPNPYDDKKIDDQKEKLEREKLEKNNDAKSETEEKSLQNTKTNENEKINTKLLNNNQSNNKNDTMQSAIQNKIVKPINLSKTNLVVDEENHHCHQTLN